MSAINAVILVVVLGLVAPSFPLRHDSEYSTCYYDNSTFYVKMGVKDTHDGIAWGFFDDTINETGYAILSITTREGVQDYIQVGGAGYLEGFLTAERIYQLWLNLGVKKAFNTSQPSSPYVFQYGEAAMNYTYEMLSKHQTNDENAEDEETHYWVQVGLVMAQFEGLVSGYNDAAHYSDLPPPSAIHTGHVSYQHGGGH